MSRTYKCAERHCPFLATVKPEEDENIEYCPVHAAAAIRELREEVANLEDALIEAEDK